MSWEEPRDPSSNRHQMDCKDVVSITRYSVYSPRHIFSLRTCATSVTLSIYILVAMLCQLATAMFCFLLQLIGTSTRLVSAS